MPERLLRKDEQVRKRFSGAWRGAAPPGSSLARSCGKEWRLCLWKMGNLLYIVIPGAAAVASKGTASRRTLRSN